MNELHLRYQSETGTYPTSKELFDEDKCPVFVASDEYTEWLEDLALKQIKQLKVNTDGTKAMTRMGNIKLCFEGLKSNINAIYPDDVQEYEITQISDDCDDLESAIYD